MALSVFTKAKRAVQKDYDARRISRETYESVMTAISENERAASKQAAKPPRKKRKVK